MSGMSETQRTIRAMNPLLHSVGGKSSREDFIDNWDIGKLDRPDNNYEYFREARRVISESKPEDIRQGLMERTERAWDTGEFDNIRFADLPGDVASP